MSRWIAIVAGIVVLLIAAVIAAPMLIPGDVYKQRVVALVKAQTGRDLVIGGAVGLSFFPRLAVKVEDVRFANAAWARDKDMTAMKEMRAALKILPLFKGEVEIDSFVLVDPVIHLEVKADGTPNWQFETAKPAAPAAAPAGQASPGGSMRQIRLGEVSIQNGAATYRNAQTGTSLAFEKVDVDLSLPGLDEPFTADGSLVWNSEPLKLALKADRPRALTEGGETPVEFALTSSKVGASYKGSVQVLGGTRFTGGVDLNVPSVRELAQWLGSPLPAGNGFGPLSIKGNAQGGGNIYTFSDARIGFDGMNATGKLSVKTGGARPMLTGGLAFDRIDANIYLAPGGGGASAAVPVGPAGGGSDDGWSNEPIDLSGLKAADADISLSTKELLVKDIKIGESALDLKLDNGVLNVDLDKLALYKGAGSGALTLDGSGHMPQMDAAFSIAGVQAEPLLTDAAGFSRLDGLTALSFAVNGTGRSQREIVGTLGGKGEVKFTNGAIKGVNLAQLVRTVLTAPATGWQSGGSQDTDFSELGGTFTIARGILTNSDLKMLSPLVRLAGSGTVDLPNRTLNYRLEPKLAATLQGQGGGDAKGLEVPVIIEGPWARPRFRPDLASMIQNREQTIETIKNLKGEGGKELLKGLLGGQTGETPATGAPAKTDGEKTKPQDALKKLFGG